MEKKWKIFCKKGHFEAFSVVFERLEKDTKKPARPLFISVRGLLKVVLKRGLEPLSLSAYAPQAYVSTNFTT